MEEGLKEWKANIFGNIKVAKRKIEAKLGGIQRMIHDGRGNPFLYKLEKDLHHQLETLLYLEELSW